MSLFGNSFPPEEQIKIDEEHDAEIDAEATDFGAKCFDGILCAREVIINSEYPECKTNVH